MDSQQKKIGKVNYSVVVPVYNSEESLTELFERVNTIFTKLNESFEIVFVDDNSLDNSWEILQKLNNANPRLVTIIQLARNFGQHNAIFCGLNFINGKYVITLDDDLQIPPEEIEKLILRYKETKADLIYGDLTKKNHSFIRNQGSKVLKNAAKKRYKSAQGKGSSFKLFKRQIADSILGHGQTFVYIDELLLWYTGDIDFVPVKHVARKYQKSTYTLRKLFKLFFNISLYYTKAPLKLITYGGIALSIFSFIIGINFIIRKIFFNVPLGYTSIIVAVLFSTSIILFSLGVIGEYLNRMFMVQSKKPAFSIKQIKKVKGNNLSKDETD